MSRFNASIPVTGFPIKTIVLQDLKIIRLTYICMVRPTRRKLLNHRPFSRSITRVSYLVIVYSQLLSKCCVGHKPHASYPVFQWSSLGARRDATVWWVSVIKARSIQMGSRKWALKLGYSIPLTMNKLIFHSFFYVTVYCQRITSLDFWKKIVLC